MAKTHSLAPPTWQQLKEFAFGRLMLRPVDFYEYTMEEFLLAARGFRDGEMELFKKFRLVAWSNLAPWGKLPPPEQWMPLGDEKEGISSAEEAIAWKNKLYEDGILRRN